MDILILFVTRDGHCVWLQAVVGFGPSVGCSHGSDIVISQEWTSIQSFKHSCYNLYLITCI